MATNIETIADGALHRVKYVSIEGIPGTGKSSCLQFLKEIRNERANSLTSRINASQLGIFCEPLSSWQALKLDGQAVDILRGFYRNQTMESAQILQMYISDTLYSQGLAIREHNLSSEDARAVSERSMDSSRLFINALFKMGIFDEARRDAQLAFSDSLQEKVKLKPLRIVLSIPAGAALERVKTRKREGEEMLTEQYLQVLADELDADLTEDDLVMPFNPSRSAKDVAMILARKLFAF